MDIFEGRDGMWLRRFILAAVIMLGLFLLVQTVGALIGLNYIGTDVTAANTIQVSGYGQYLAVPDIATFTFDVTSDQTTVAAAQAAATAKINAVTPYLE